MYAVIIMYFSFLHITVYVLFVFFFLFEKHHFIEILNNISSQHKNDLREIGT